ncbi:hypothetical protein KCU64_g55, partial [Aureobasidium melanogenum]
MRYDVRLLRIPMLRAWLPSNAACNHSYSLYKKLQQPPPVHIPTAQMNEEQLVKIHRDPLDPWEPVHAAARIINNQVALYPRNHNSALAARQLDALTPFNRTLKRDEQAEDIQSFLWEFWEVVVKLSQAYDEFGIGDIAQTCIVEILEELQKIEAHEVVIWGRTSKLWGNLPIFGPVLTEFYGKWARRGERWEERGLTSALQICLNIRSGFVRFWIRSKRRG